MKALQRAIARNRATATNNDDGELDRSLGDGDVFILWKNTCTVQTDIGIGILCENLVQHLYNTITLTRRQGQKSSAGVSVDWLFLADRILERIGFSQTEEKLTSEELSNNNYTSKGFGSNTFGNPILSCGKQTYWCQTMTRMAPHDTMWHPTMPCWPHDSKWCTPNNSFFNCLDVVIWTCKCCGQEFRSSLQKAMRTTSKISG